MQYAGDQARAALTAVRKLHDRVGETDGDDIDVLAFWEELGTILDEVAP